MAQNSKLCIILGHTFIPMTHKLHKEVLDLILLHAEKGTKHTLLDNYFGNTHTRLPISVPVLRGLAKSWMLKHRELSSAGFSKLLTSLIQSESYTEKCFAGILLDYTTAEQRQFDPKLFNAWLDHLEGWAEIDTLCTGDYARTEILLRWNKWKPLLIQLSKSKNIGKRRASIVLLCSPLRNSRDERLTDTALENIERLKSETDILITKAISWALRSMEKHHRKKLTRYMKENSSSLPKIAVRETLAKLKTGTKTKRKN